MYIIFIVYLHLPEILFDVRMLHAVQCRQVDDVSRLSDFQVASEWPTLTGMVSLAVPHNYFAGGKKNIPQVSPFFVLQLKTNKSVRVSFNILKHVHF